MHASSLVSVVGARGGLGTSTFAAAVALVGAEHQRVALVDGSPRNGLEVLLGRDDHTGPTWQMLARLHEAGGTVASTRMATDDDLVPTVLAWESLGSTSEALSRWAVDLLRATHDLVIADAGTCSTPTERALINESGAIVLLVPGEMRALTYAAHLVPTLAGIAPIHLVACPPSPSGIPENEIADLLNLPLAAVLEREPRLPVRGEHAQLPTRRLRAAVISLFDALGI